MKPTYKLTNVTVNSYCLRLIFFLGCLFTFTTGIHAQVARLYNNQQGLKTSNCHGVDIDSKGFVWVSGSNTLGIFDGVRFQYLPTTGADGRQLFQIAKGVTEVENDHYWVCSSHGLFLLDARTMQFEHIFLHEREDSIYGYAPNDIIDYPKEDCKLVTTDGYGTYVLNSKTRQVDQQLSMKLSIAVNDGYVTQPLIDRHQQLWVTTKNEPLICISLKNIQRKPLNYTPAAAALLNNSSVTTLFETEEGLIIGTNHGLLLYDRRENLVYESPSVSYHDLYISSILRTHDHRILVGTDGQGIWEYSTTEGGAPTLQVCYGQMMGIDITYGKVMEMKEDHKGNIIAILLQKGLVVIPPQNDCFHYHTISPVANGQNATCITSMAIDSQQNYWVATDGCGVFTTNGMALGTAHPINEGLHSMLVQSILIDKHGTVWVGSFGGGVQYMEHGRWTEGWLSELNQGLIMTMYYDKADDQLFVGTNGQGVYVIDIAERTLQPITFPFEYNPWISCLLHDHQRRLWVGTSSGLFWYDNLSKKHGEVNLNGVRICNASAIQQDGTNILIACEEGLIIYNKETQQQELISKEQGLSVPNVRSITVTDSHIWLSTSTHIASVDKRTHQVRNYSSFSGYEIGEFHRNSFIQPGEGYILFGGDNGIICFKPELISNRKTEVKHVYFTAFNSPQHTEKLDASIFYAQSIHLDHDNNSFNISFSTNELGDPTRIHYDYILEGHEQQWHTDSPTPSANYSSVPPGCYTFRVRAYLEDDPEECAENSILICINAPWYATGWAFGAYAVLALLLAYFIYLQIKARRQQREQLRASAERDRMKEAKLRLFTSITHELRSPLTMIESPLKQLKSEDTNAQHQELYAVMQRNCDRLLGIVKQITDIRKIDAGQLTLKMEEQDYVSYSNHVFEQFKGVASVKNIQFVIEHSEEELTMMMDVTHFEKIITNLLSNAFKFTPEGGKVVAKSGIVDEKIELHFYNSGSHFDEEDLKHLWERFYQGSASPEKTGSGIGLNLVHELVKMHHGSIEARNIEPDGVEFTLHFPYYHGSHVPENSSRPTLLLTDDDTELVNYLSSQLNKDYNIIYAFSGNSAWKQVLAQRPDIVVTDYSMPDGDGMELCQRIKGNPDTENTPIIMLTGEGDEMLQLHSLNIQVDHYLEKPVNLVLLRSAITQALSVRKRMLNKARRTEIADEMPIPEMQNAEDRLFNKVNEIMKQQLDNSEFSVQQLSDEVGISRVHLNRKMKERYGVSPNVFIKSFRLKQAAYLLVNNRVNVSEVAYKVGFSSHSYFTTSFHDHFGMSPKEFVAFYSEEENAEALRKLLE